MKSQDIFLLFKIISIQRKGDEFNKDIFTCDEKNNISLSRDWELDEKNNISLPRDWGFYRENTYFSKDYGLDEENIFSKRIDEAEYSENWISKKFTVRSLEESTGISKSEISNSIERNIKAGLLKIGQKNEFIVNKAGLLDLCIYGIKYVFSVKEGAVGKGISTGIGAPVFNKKLFSGSDINPVWFDSKGKTIGPSIEPLFKTVPYAVKKDYRLYAYMALIDSLRIGRARECKIASEILTETI